MKCNGLTLHTSVNLPTKDSGLTLGEVERAIPISGPLFHRRNDFVCNTNIRRCEMQSFERCFRRSAFEACFEGVELQGKGRHRKPKIHHINSSTRGSRSIACRAPGKMGNSASSAHQFDNIVTAQRGVAFGADRTPRHRGFSVLPCPGTRLRCEGSQFLSLSAGPANVGGLDLPAPGVPFNVKS